MEGSQEIVALLCAIKALRKERTIKNVIQLHWNIHAVEMIIRLWPDSRAAKQAEDLVYEAEKLLHDIYVAE